MLSFYMILMGASQSISSTPIPEIIEICSSVQDAPPERWVSELRDRARQSEWPASDDATLVIACSAFAAGKIEGLKIALDQNTEAGRLAIENDELRRQLKQRNHP